MRVSTATSPWRALFSLKPSTSGVRLLSTKDAAEGAPAYPYSSRARVIPPSTLPPHPQTSLLRKLNLQLAAAHPLADKLIPLFSRRSKDRLLPGSVITVSSYSSPPSVENPSPSINTFSGVLIAVRRRHAGQDTSFRLRNMVGRTGVEVAFKLLSPLLADIKVVLRAKASGPLVVSHAGKELERKKPAIKAARRAKLYFVRDQPDRLTNVGPLVKQQKEREAAVAAKRTRQGR